MRTLFLFFCLFLITCGANRSWATGNVTVDSSTVTDRTADRSRYINIGDGSSQEFEFPENTDGVIVISSHYQSSANSRKGRQSWKETVKVRSLDPEVLSILNVTDSGHAGPVKSFIIRIRSGFPGMAQLQIQLLHLDQDSMPVLIEERTDYSIRVAPGEDDPATRLIQSGGLSHFTENPVLFALLPLIFINKCAFGCKVEVEVLRGLVRSPVPLLLGVVGQFLVMPLYAYCVSWLTSLPKALSLGLVITCSAPGGGGGYLYSLLLGGDVTLAISMTLVSTVVATAAMPLSSALYGWLLGVHAALHVPFVKILGTLLFIAIPISLGMLIKLRLPALTRVLLVLIRPFSFVLMVGGIFMAYQMGASILANVKPQIVAIGVTVPLLGLVVGAVLAKMAGLAPLQRKTVSIEVGVQNSLLALAVMQLSFQRVEADFASQAPFLVALSSTSEMLLIVLGYFVHQKIVWLCCPQE
ncbi:P3 protein [Nothobranchius furzeri]|uniref:Solute carrier family 10 (Sodium/bile acid cotransporter family), member 3 n=1 Tax=Nothobranchius furzeri TaxID=105023 RepID=A0A1A8TZA7_NOTFU|nr:solute carrier family 10 member 3 [Nothobranchius furzeri]